MHIGDEVAQIVVSQYNSLPKKGKPLLRSNGVQEWTVLAGVVIRNTEMARLECVSIGTGVKALPEQRIQSQGRVLHDCHAEILALRGFNLYCILHGIEHIGAVYLYISAPPCGDASMGLLNAKGGDEWMKSRRPEPGELIRGRGHYNCVGHIRTKPGRADSNVTMSKSCSDKLTLRQVRGLLLCSVKRLYAKQIYLTGIVCPDIDYADFERAFSRWSPLHRFEFLETTVRFEDYHPDSGAPSPCSLVWTPDCTEVLANGIIQGSKGASSRLSRCKLLEASQQKDRGRFADISRYYDLKTDNWWPQGWIRTAEDDFCFDPVK